MTLEDPDATFATPLISALPNLVRTVTFDLCLERETGFRSDDAPANCIKITQTIQNKLDDTMYFESPYGRLCLWWEINLCLNPSNVGPNQAPTQRRSQTSMGSLRRLVRQIVPHHFRESRGFLVYQLMLAIAADQIHQHPATTDRLR